MIKIDYTLYFPQGYTPSSFPLVRETIFDGLSTYGSIVGRVLSAVGKAVEVQKKEGNIIYVSTKSLMNRLTPGSSSSLERNFLEALHPVAGKPLAEENVEAFAAHFKKQSASRDQFDRYQSRHLQTLKFDKATLVQHLRPGDVFFYKGRGSDESFFEKLIILGQKLKTIIFSSPFERQAFRFSHVALYLGDGKIAEASPDPNGADVRILAIDDDRFAPPTEQNQYFVARCQDPILGREAADVALRVAKEVQRKEDKDLPTQHGYAYVDAIRSVFHSTKFGPMGRYRYLKQYLDDHRNEIPRGFLKKRSFFCSYFVGYCYQTAESRRVMPAILGEEDGPLKAKTRFGKGVFRDLWARERRIEKWKAMNRVVQCKYDAKRFTPFAYRQFVTRNPHLFKDMFVCQLNQ